MVFLNVSLCFTWVKTAPNIRAAIVDAPIKTILGFKECSIAIEDIFKIPTISLNHDGKPYSLNSFFILSYV